RGLHNRILTDRRRRPVVCGLRREAEPMSAAELEKVRGMWQGLLAALAPPAGIAEYRVGYDEMLAAFPVPGDAVVEEVDAGGVRALLVTAAGASSDRVVVWTHSGGYVFGSADGYRFFGAGLSAACGGQVLL